MAIHFKALQKLSALPGSSFLAIDFRMIPTRNVLQPSTRAFPVIEVIRSHVDYVNEDSNITDGDRINSEELTLHFF